MASKPQLSSRVMGLKFMQRAKAKVDQQEAAEVVQELDAEAHWVADGARTRCVVIAEGDPPPSSGGPARLSFGGFGTEAAQVQAEAADREQHGAAEVASPCGKSVSDEAMAATLKQQKSSPGGQQHKQQTESPGGQQQRHKQRHDGQQRDGKRHCGKKHRRDDEGRGKPQQKSQRARYF